MGGQFNSTTKVKGWVRCHSKFHPLTKGEAVIQDPGSQINAGDYAGVVKTGKRKSPSKSITWALILAEWTGLIVNHQKPLNTTVFKGSNQWHVVKTCGKLMLA